MQQKHSRFQPKPIPKSDSGIDHLAAIKFALNFALLDKLVCLFRRTKLCPKMCFKASCLQGFQLTHSLGGGTGSGKDKVSEILVTESIPLACQLFWIFKYFGSVKGILHQKIFYRLNLIFWIVMGCGIADFDRRGL